METILVGIDASKGAQAAARWAAAEAEKSGARIVAVHAERRTELWSMSALQINIDPFLADLQELLDGRWSAPFRKAGIEHTTQLVRGDPATELLRVAKRVRASMLVLGSRSHSNLADLIVGGTVHKVINRSTIPVVLVPATPPAKKTASTRVAAAGSASKGRARSGAVG